MFPTTAFSFLLGLCKLVLGSPYNEELQITYQVKTEQRTSFNVNSLSVSFDVIALFIKGQKLQFLLHQCDTIIQQYNDTMIIIFLHV